MTTPTLSALKIRKKSAVLELSYSNNECLSLSFELLRVYSPSAEVRGHNGQHSVLQVGKSDVQIKHIETVGNYGIQIYFDDGHSTGIYSWPYLYDLAVHQAQYEQDYLAQLEAAGKSRISGAVQIMDFKKP